MWCRCPLSEGGTRSKSVGHLSDASAPNLELGGLTGAVAADRPASVWPGQTTVGQIREGNAHLREAVTRRWETLGQSRSAVFDGGLRASASEVVDGRDLAGGLLPYFRDAVMSPPEQTPVRRVVLDLGPGTP